MRWSASWAAGCCSRPKRMSASRPFYANPMPLTPALSPKGRGSNSIRSNKQMSEITNNTSWRHVTDLTGKTVVVTGCASGIGRAAAMQFADAGAIVYGGDRNEADGRATIAAIHEAGGKGDFIPLDLTSGASIDAFVDAAVSRIGGAPDIIANVAGLDRVMPFAQNTPEVWELLAQVNYIGPVRMIIASCR